MIGKSAVIALHWLNTRILRTLITQTQKNMGLRRIKIDRLHGRLVRPQRNMQALLGEIYSDR